MARSKGYDNAGQPPKWKSPKELQDKVDEYFKYCEDYEKHPTIAGLAYYTGVSRQTIYNYSYKDEFFDIIKKARDYIMMGLEETAIVKGNAGTIFVMKQYGYRDRQEVEANIKASDFTEALGRFTDKL